MKRWKKLFIDMALVALATIGALFVRDDLELHIDRLVGLFPYLGISVSVAFVVCLVGKMNRGAWRFSSLSDYLRIVVLATLVVIVSLAIAFVVNRLDNLARSLPLIQLLLMIAVLIFVRVMYRIWYIFKTGRVHSNALAEIEKEHVLLVGINAIAELYIRVTKEFGRGKIVVAGILSEENIQSGHFLQGKEILGNVEHLLNIIEELEVHGVFIQRILLTVNIDVLNEDARNILLEVERSSSIVIVEIAELFRF